MATVKELLVRFKGDTKGLENATNQAESTINNFSKKVQKTAFSLKGVLVGLGNAATVLGVAYTTIGLTNERAQEAVKGILTEFGRLIQDIEKATGAGETLKKVFDTVTSSITVIRAGVATIPSLFKEIQIAGKLAFIDIAQTAEDFLNRYSQAVEKATFGLRKARDFDLTSGIGFDPDALQGLTTYEAELEKILVKNQELDLAEEVAGKKRTTRNTSANDALRKQNDLIKAQERAWHEATRAIQEQQERLRGLRTEAADMFADLAEGTKTFKQTAIEAISEIARNMLRLSFGGEASSGIGGSIATALVGGLGSLFGGGFNPATSAPPRKPTFASGGSFVVRGNSGTDRNMMSLNGQAIANVSKGESVTVGKGNNSGGNVYQTLNITTGVQQTVRAEIQRLLPQISSASIRANTEAMARGKV